HFPVLFESGSFRKSHAVQITANLRGWHKEFGSETVCLVFWVIVGRHVVHHHMRDLVTERHPLAITGNIFMHEKHRRNLWSVKRPLADSVHASQPERASEDNSTRAFDHASDMAHWPRWKLP